MPTLATAIVDAGPILEINETQSIGNKKGFWHHRVVHLGEAEGRSATTMPTA
jgi:hypothetical protein